MFLATEFEGLWVIEPTIFGDERGYFFESFNQHKFEKETGLAAHFVQDNESLSAFGVLRGLHSQLGEYAQAKLVRVLSGKILDVVVDMRPGSATFGRSFSLILSEENKQQLYIPRGFVHGFVVLSQSAKFSYKCDNFYSPKHELGIIYNDPDLAIDWQLPEDQLVISEKDKNLPTFQAVERLTVVR